MRKKECSKLWTLLVTASLLFTGCKVTRENTLEAFTKLPLEDTTQVALVVRENHGSSCHSFVVEAVYYSPESIEEVVTKVEGELLRSGWQSVGQDLSLEAKVRYARYDLNDSASLSIYPEVNTISAMGLWDSKEHIDLDSLTLSEGHLLDNSNPEDGYFLIEFYYYPYPPNECSG